MGFSVSKISQTTSSFVKAAGKRSIMETRAQVFHGVNPTITYKPSGKTFDLPRFISVEMKEARQMNRIAINQAKRPYVRRYSEKVTIEDLERVTSETVEASYARAIWTNPKDGKVYTLLKECETDDGKVIVRILDEESAFVKNAVLTPKTIVIAEPTNISENICILKVNNKEFKHYELLNILAKRFNPFAKIKLLITKDFDTLFNEINKTKADYLSVSFGKELQIEKEYSVPGKIIKDYIKSWLNTNYPDFNKVNSDYFQMIPSGTRVLVSSGNVGNNSYEVFLTQNGVEGVGGLNTFGKKHIGSASANSLFTQHYEKFTFIVKETSEGINISGLSGTDYATDGFNIKLSPKAFISGTSYSTPIRAAKLALNDMMEGIL